MGNVPHYPWYPDDYLSSPWVMGCTLAEEGIYRRLLDFQWKSHGCQLPDDLPYLRRLLKKGATDRQLMSVLKANFTQIVLNGDTTVWRNERLYVEYCKAMSKSEKARESVKLRKTRPIRQSNDNRMVEQKSESCSIGSQSNDNLPEVEVKVEPQVEVEPQVKTITTCPDSLRLSGLLASLILMNKPDYRELQNGNKEATITRWAKDISLMLRRDARDIGQIEEVIIWSQKDNFWYTNILSAEKLRKQFDKLVLDMQKPNRVQSKKHAGIDAWLQETYHDAK